MIVSDIGTHAPIGCFGDSQCIHVLVLIFSIYLMKYIEKMGSRTCLLTISKGSTRSEYGRLGKTISNKMLIQ